ncbi:MAG: hypothetical protein ABDH21_02890 [bacterium]
MEIRQTNHLITPRVESNRVEPKNSQKQPTPHQTGIKGENVNIQADNVYIVNNTYNYPDMISSATYPTINTNPILNIGNLYRTMCLPYFNPYSMYLYPYFAYMPGLIWGSMFSSLFSNVWNMYWW